ncbi:Uncharacterised protein [Citrobacter koseri]|uniref:Uncharacterized protein n=1 Tax=Citrobacter koseri TaxID=545 RepID=A0A2X2WNF9_CITKO|nr:Uncharacterised protein [Citrobacter koseri]
MTMTSFEPGFHHIDDFTEIVAFSGHYLGSP